MGKKGITKYFNSFEKGQRFGKYEVVDGVRTFDLRELR